MHEEHEARGVPVEVEAAWLHHRFAQIHPYQDGNGRVARALASLLFLKAGRFPAVVTRDDRSRYIEALETADEGDLRPFVGFLVYVQRRALFQATQVAADVQPAETVEEAIKALGRAVTARDQRGTEAARRAETVANELMRIATVRLRGIKGELGVMLNPLALIELPLMTPDRHVGSVALEVEDLKIAVWA